MEQYPVSMRLTRVTTKVTIANRTDVEAGCTFPSPRPPPKIAYPLTTKQIQLKINKNGAISGKHEAFQSYHEGYQCESYRRRSGVYTLIPTPPPKSRTCLPQSKFT